MASVGHEEFPQISNHYPTTQELSVFYAQKVKASNGEESGLTYLKNLIPTQSSQEASSSRHRQRD